MDMLALFLILFFFGMATHCQTSYDKEVRELEQKHVEEIKRLRGSLNETE